MSNSGIGRNSWELIATTPELNGTELDAIPESVEFIPGAESIPQCSTSRNRMYFLRLGRRCRRGGVKVGINLRVTARVGLV